MLCHVGLCCAMLGCVGLCCRGVVQCQIVSRSQTPVPCPTVPRRAPSCLVTTSPTVLILTLIFFFFPIPFFLSLIVSCLLFFSSFYFCFLLSLPSFIHSSILIFPCNSSSSFPSISSLSLYLHVLPALHEPPLPQVTVPRGTVAAGSRRTQS